MRTPGPQSIELLPLAGRRVGGELALDAADRPAVPRDPILREPADDGMSGAFGGAGQSQAGPAVDGADGPGGAAPQAADHNRDAGRAGLSLLAPRSGADPRRRGVEFGHHVCTDEARLHVSDGGDRLVQPVRAVVAVVELAGGSVLPGGVGRGADDGAAGDLQYRPRISVHIVGIDRLAGGGRDGGGPGRVVWGGAPG